MRGTIRRNLAATVAALAFMAIMPAVSHAGAAGIQYWGSFYANVGGQNVLIPSGQLGHEILGSGYYVSRDRGEFISGPVMCDPSMRFTYGNGSLSYRRSVHWGCSRNGRWDFYPARNMPRGSACAELWAKNWRVLVARQCHYIHG